MARSKSVTDIDDPRLVKALAHPLRIRIMGILERQSATPKALATELGVPLENLSYHVRELKRFGFIELEKERAVRGAVEHHYRAIARPRITAQAWERLPTIVRDAFDAATLESIIDVVNRAAFQGKLDRPLSHISRRPVVLDEDGFAQASTVIADALNQITSIERDSKKRLKEDHDGEVPAVVIAMLFDAPEPNGAGPAPVQARRGGGRRSRAEATT
jgi:DNA-binding transcriptional ArsR family regulator